jgi:uncharacterized radical SAM superfamily Fe-S cluster-containing enzyme
MTSKIDMKDENGETARTFDTYSICPVCLKPLRARRIYGESVRLERECPEHGKFSSVVWRNFVDWEAWTKNALRPAWETEERDIACASCAGLCEKHMRDTCCTLLEVTSRCDLHCRFCFADGGRGEENPSLEEIVRRIGILTRPGKTLLQLSGGEPTLRDDLPEIVAAARRAGCKYVQLNTNGLRIAEDPALPGRLADAGLSFVFLQFDGLRDDIYKTLRGRPLLLEKKRAIAACARHGVGVTLVPTIVPGVNADHIGEIVRFAVASSPAVRGVHFQPVGYLGRIPSSPADDERFTPDQLASELELQTQGSIRRENLSPSCCDHPLCTLHGDFIVLENGDLYPIGRQTNREDACCSDPAEKNREFVARRWLRKKETASCRCGYSSSIPAKDITDMDYFLERIRSHGFTITAMCFQDAWNLDIERLRSCSLHVFDGDRLKPFCAYYIAKTRRS